MKYLTAWFFLTCLYIGLARLAGDHPLWLNALVSAGIALMVVILTWLFWRGGTFKL